MVSAVTRRSAAAYFGFRPGDRVISIQGETIDTLDELDRALFEFEGAERWPVVIERNGEQFERTLAL